jgi:peptidoglycan-N-acetylglucosamine deacetylase
MQKQVFQTHSATRWKSFVWFVRIIVVFLILGIASVLFSLMHKQYYDLKVLTYKTKKFPEINTDSSKTFITNAEQEAFALHLDKIRAKRRNSFYQTTQFLPRKIKLNLPVKAAFYVNWDQQSANSLQKNIGNLNMVLPEWIFQKDSKANIELQIDSTSLNVMRKNKVAILPMLSNNYNDRWNGDSTLLLLKDSLKRSLLISRIKAILDKNKFQGINIDLESLPEATIPFLMKFSKELSMALQPSGYLTSIDVDPMDKRFSFKELASYYDFIFLMAYDEHYPEGKPGSISSLPYIEKALDNAMKDVPSEKFVLCIAGYGYDWTIGGTGKDITYNDFISLVNENKSPVSFDMKQSDLSMTYYDDDDVTKHEVHCNDAAGIFNILRTAEDYNTAGTALWYIGSEDTRIWNYYSKNLNEDYLNIHPFNYKKLQSLNAISSVEYDGNGEVLEIISEPKPGNATIHFDINDQLIISEKYDSVPSSFLVKRYGTKNPKQIAITFDDGPDEDYTPHILDILKEKHVPATFFVTGINSENNIPLIERIYREGHEIGDHTFTHPNLEITSPNRERIELRSTRLLLESILGYSTILFRPPYNTDAEPKTMYQLKPLVTAFDEGFICVASSIDPNDWQEGVSADTIVARAIAQQNLGNVILLHDAGGERSQTLLALPRIIDYYKKQGFQFVSVSTLMGKSRDQIMPKVQGQRYTATLDKLLFFFAFIWEHFLDGFFVIAIFLIIGRLVAVALLAILQHRKERKEKRKIDLTYLPKVSIIVPAYNEEVNAVRTVNGLLLSDYPNFDIIFVDDGSKDKTYANILAAFENNLKVRVLTKPNGGKASALNFGIEQADGEILVCIDADTILTRDAISLMIPFFVDGKVAGVAGSVRVGNTLNLLTNWQSIEYITSQNFDRRAFDFVNAILVIPGAIGAFRKSAIDEIGAFTTDTLAEDCDLTLRLLCAGYIVRTCNEAMALTEAPEDRPMFLKQRFRWSFGMMQSFWKHRDLLFSFKKINIGWIVLPNLLIYNFIIPLFSPVVDIMFIAGLFTKHAGEYLFFYVLYFVVDCIISSLAYRYDNQNFDIKTALYLFIQRFIYRQLLFFVLLKAYLKAMKGELASWGVLKRTGNVKSN